MRNHNIKFTLKAVKICKDDERNIFAPQFFLIYFKHNLAPIIILAIQRCSRCCHLLQGRELVDLCSLTQAEKAACPPSSHPFDLDKERASQLELFFWSDSPHAVSHTHKKAQWLRPTLQPPCHRNRSPHFQVIQHRSHPTSGTLCQAPTEGLSRLSPKQKLTHWPLGAHWSLSALKPIVCKTFTEPGSLQQQIHLYPHLYASPKSKTDLLQDSPAVEKPRGER